jgi:hypothetical protein
MPTIARRGPYRVLFYSNNGVEPPHVHVQRERLLAKFWLDPVALSSNSGFRAHELRDLEALVIQNRSSWLEAWDEFFGR